MTDWAPIPNDEIEAAVRARTSASQVRILKRSRFRPTMGATGSYFERLKLEVDGQRVPAVLKRGALPVGPQARESLFFARYAGAVPIRTAACYAVGPGVSDETWVLMSRLPRGKRLVEWTHDDNIEALRNLARLHARFLNQAPPDLPRPFTKQLEDSLSFVAGGVQGLRAAFDEYPGVPRFVSDRSLDLLIELASQPRIFADPFAASPETLLHGDYHRGNLIARDGEEQIAFDWQFACAGPPAYDLGVFWHYLGIVNKPLFFRFVDRVGLEERALTWEEIVAAYADELRTLRPEADIEAILSCADAAIAWESVRQITYMAAGMTQTHSGAFRFVYRDHRTIGGFVARVAGIDRVWLAYEQLFADFEERAERLLGHRAPATA